MLHEQSGNNMLIALQTAGRSARELYTIFYEMRLIKISEIKTGGRKRLLSLIDLPQCFIKSYDTGILLGRVSRIFKK